MKYGSQEHLVKLVEDLQQQLNFIKQAINHQNTFADFLVPIENYKFAGMPDKPVYYKDTFYIGLQPEGSIEIPNTRRNIHEN